MEAAELRTNLSLLDLVSFGFKYESVRNALPQLNEALKMSRTELENIIGNFVGEDFLSFKENQETKKTRNPQDEWKKIIALE